MRRLPVPHTLATATAAVTLATIATTLLAPIGAAAQSQCCGDCNGNGEVTVDELVTSASHALHGCTPSSPCVHFPATGQTISYAAGDDGDVRAGAALRYVDNHDGTITDLNTGLMWEKKIALDNTVDAADLHDADNCYPWAGTCNVGGALCGTDTDCGASGPCNAADCQGGNLTIFKWVVALNAENSGAGFAGHHDWRVPNQKELESIVDLSNNTPAVNAAFSGGRCGCSDVACPTCADLTNPVCSCTHSNFYWSSTTFATSPHGALIVDFGPGYVDAAAKTSSNYVRAVRGGL